MTEIIEIEVSNETVAAEVGHAIRGRSMDIHENPHDDFEWIAEELRDVGSAIVDEYE